MVKVRADLALLPDGQVDIDAWADELVAQRPQLDLAAILEALRYLKSLERAEENLLETSLEFAELAAALRLDTASVVAALMFRALRREVTTADELVARFGPDVVHLLDEVQRMGAASLLEMSNARLQTSERRDQVENVRRMLVAMIADARVAVLKLAERIVALRSARQADEDRRVRIAREAHLIFAPLANRLGIWQVKWELEDLALRFLAPDIYVSIARQLDGRREVRERQVEEIALALNVRLESQGIPAVVTGRAKHIYSIWRKMQAKHIGIDQVYDVRAVRVLVDSTAQCYAALGVIHTQWRHIPSEFDDYIASPKENGYRSIHTAVQGPEGMTLEVQIRTHEMHREAELGVCAHWSYKDGAAEDRPYSEKMNWLRQVVEQSQLTDQINPLAASTELGDELNQLFREERIFVYTPKGHVVDLTTTSTPLDFAFRVHTSVGYRCRAALVDGQPIPLNATLRTGQCVEIVTAAAEAPERDWLDLHLEYVHTSRARQKLHEWFRDRPAAVNAQAGRERLFGLLERIGMDRFRADALEKVALRLDFATCEALFEALGGGDCQVLDVIDLLEFEEQILTQGSPMTETLPGIEPPNSRPGIRRLVLEATDRPGLLSDIVDVVGGMGLMLTGNSGRIDPVSGHAIFELELPLAVARDVACLVDRLRHVNNILDARCASSDFE